MDWGIVLMTGAGSLAARVCNGLGDGAAMAVRRMFLPRVQPRKTVPVGNGFTYALGRMMDTLAAMFRRPVTIHYESTFAAFFTEFGKSFKSVTRSVSFGLLMFCIGLVATLVWLLVL